MHRPRVLPALATDNHPVQARSFRLAGLKTAKPGGAKRQEKWLGKFEQGL
jgi:hypothetical protein